METQVGLAGQPLTLTYDTARAPWTQSGGFPSPGEVVVPGDLGKLWWSSLHRQLYLSANGVALQAARGDGSPVSFTLQNGAWVSNDPRTAGNDQRDTLAVASGNFLYYDQKDLALERYDGTGLLQSWSSTSGTTLTPTYSTGPSSSAPAAGYLLSLTDPFLRSVSFTYAALSTGDVGIASITDPNGRSIIPGYDGSGNLTSLVWQDTATSGYAYASPNSGQSWALTGLIDENAKGYASFGYDAVGHATSTQLAGGVDAYSVSYVNNDPGPQVVISESYDSVNNVIWRYHDWVVPQPPVVTWPNLSAETFNAPSVALNYPRDTGHQQPAGSGCGASANAITYDANGNKASEDDFDGHRACYLSDLSRNLEQLRVEGLTGGTSGTACSSVIGTPTSTIPAGSRKVSTTWHPRWRLPAQVAEPRKLTTYSYNDAGGTCEATGATLPDGNRIAVLCSKTEQATTDSDGHLGFSAAIDTSVASRTWSYTYDQYGHVLSATDPAGNTTCSAYYGSTSFSGTDPNAVGHTTGDLQYTGHLTSGSCSTAAPGSGLTLVTQYTSYTKAGQLLQSQDPNGVLTDYTYFPRGWLHTASVAGQTTTYDYWPTGLLKQLTQPDGSFIAYTYDDAHRLTDVSNNLGNSIHYTLDNLGNRTAEDTKDPSGTLARSLSRSIDALGRVQSVTGRPQ